MPNKAKHPKPDQSKYANKRSAEQREHDLAAIAELHLAGKIQREIAAIISSQRPYVLSRSQIREDIYEIEARWIRASMDAINLRKAKELQKLVRLEVEYRDAYARSCGKQETTTVEKIEGAPAAAKKGADAAKRMRVTQTSQNQPGDPRYLHGVLECIQERCKIFGVYEASRLEVSGPAGTPVAVDQSARVTFFLPTNGRELETADLTHALDPSEARPRRTNGNGGGNGKGNDAIAGKDD